jgi:hypothetical protein
LIALAVSLVAVASLLQRGPHPARRAHSGTGGAADAHVRTPAPSSSPTALALPSRLSGLRWDDFYGVQLPAAPAAGPRYQRNGLAWGFADTPPGALLAAVNIGVRASAQWGPAIFVPTIRRQMTGLGAGALLVNCRTSYIQEARAAGVTGGRPLGRGYAAEEAFRWVAYTPADATVDIVSAGPGPQGSTVRAVTRIEVLWVRGDWRAVAPPGGDWGNSAAPVTSLRGYILFPGQS